MAITEESRKFITARLKQSLKNLVPPMVVKPGKEKDGFEIIGNTPVPYGHDKKIIEGMFFASIAQRKDSVAFYFFPAYSDPAMKDIAPSLFKCLKGKTCFHFKKEEEINEKELDALLKSGIRAWERAGYVK